MARQQEVLSHIKRVKSTVLTFPVKVAVSQNNVSTVISAFVISW